MSNKVRIAIFDLYGTIINQKIGLLPAPDQAFLNTFQKVGIKDSPHLRQSINRGMGHKKIDHLKMILSDSEIHREAVGTEIYQRSFDASDHTFVNVQKHYANTLYDIFKKEQLQILDDPDYVVLDPLFLDTMERLKKDHGIKYFGTTTGFDQSMQQKVFQHIGGQFTPHCMIASDTVARARPHADGIQEIVRFCNAVEGGNLTCLNCVKIGDTVVDITEARNAGCQEVGITGTTSRETFEQYGTKHIIDSLSELPEVIGRM